MRYQRSTCSMVILMILLLALTSLPSSQAYGQLPIVRIGIVTDGPWEESEEIRSLFEQEILELARGEFDVRFPEEKLVRADWTVAGVRRAIDQLLADREVDLLLPLEPLPRMKYAIAETCLSRWSLLL